MTVTTVKLDSAPGRHRRADGELQPLPSLAAAVAAEPKPGEALPPSADPDFVEGPAPVLPSVTITLQDRHHAWLLQAAARDGRSPEHFVEGLVRQACAADPARIRNTLPQGLGQPAGTARR
jgi:hypothetical protein